MEYFDRILAGLDEGEKARLCRYLVRHGYLVRRGGELPGLDEVGYALALQGVEQILSVSDCSVSGSRCALTLRVKCR